MNLYKIKFAHYSKKSEEDGIKTYIIADNEIEVYEYIQNNYSALWKDRELYKDEYTYFNKETKKEEIEYHRERMLRFKGDINDPDVSWDDLYYGKTLYGWELIKENINSDLKNILLDLEVVSE